jgi:VWFA-related protein
MPRSLASRLLANLSAVLLAIPVSGQSPQPSPAPGAGQSAVQAKQEVPVLRVTARLVQVSVVVQDKKGEPVGDLTREDFTLSDKGQAQNISLFSIESTHAMPGPPQPAPLNVFTNRFEQKGGTPTSVTVILLDALNTRFEDLANARARVIKFLGQLQPQDRVALYTLTNNLRVLHDFTSDARSLLRALGLSQGYVSPQLSASEPEPVTPTGDAGLDALQGLFNDRVAANFIANRVRLTAAALEAIANHLGRLPGRKNLVWVSGSFPIAIGLDAPSSATAGPPEHRVFSEEVERAARALNNANLAVYPVDARGLIVPNIGPATPPAFSPSHRGQRLGPPPSMQSLYPPRENIDTMIVLADRTGGRAFYNTNDIQGSIRRAIDDSRITYVLGYYPTHGQWNGKFREIKVEVKRAGLHLRYRRGYFALPELPLDPKQRQVYLRETLEGPLDASGLGLNIRVEPIDVPGARSLKTDVQIDSRDISLLPEGERWVGALDLLFVQRGPDNKDLAGESRTFDMRLRQENYERIRKDGLVLTRTIPLAAGATQLRVVVRDANSGAIGSLTIPLTGVLPKGS